MHEQVMSFRDYVKEYGLARAEGVLLRYLTEAYRALSRTVPDRHKTDAVLDLEEWLGAEVRQVDASLLEEWARLESGLPELPISPDDAAADGSVDITRNERALSVLIRNASFRLVQAMARRDAARFVEVLVELGPDPGGESDAELSDAKRRWTLRSVEDAFLKFFGAHEALGTDADARSATRVPIERLDGRWRVRQVLSDPEEDHDFALVLDVDLELCRSQGRLIMQLLGLDSIDSPLDA
jgi:hypothetical protein